MTVATIASTPTQHNISQSVSEEGLKQSIIAYANRNKLADEPNHHSFAQKFKDLTAKTQMEILQKIHDDGNRGDFIFFRGNLPDEVAKIYEATLARFNEEEKIKRQKEKVMDSNFGSYVAISYANEKAAIKQCIQL